MLQPEKDEFNNSINIVSIKQEVEDEIEVNGVVDKIEDPVVSVELKFEEDSIDYENSGNGPEFIEDPVVSVQLKFEEDSIDYENSGNDPEFIEDPSMLVEVKYEEDSIDYENNDKDSEIIDDPVMLVELKYEEDNTDYENSGEGPGVGAGITSYEKNFQQARAERIAFLKSLKVDEAKEAVNKAKRTNKGPRKIYKSVPRSLRLLNTVNYSEQSIYYRMLQAAIIADEKDTSERPPIEVKDSNYSIIEDLLQLTSWKMKKSTSASFNEIVTKAEDAVQKITAKLEFKDSIFDASYANYVEDIYIYEPKSEPEFIYDKSVLENLTLQESDIVNFAPKGICAVAWYPSSESIILAIGYKYGNLGIWNGVSKSNPYRFKIHRDCINQVAFNPFNPVELVTSSKDGTLRSGDMKKQIFTEVYKSYDDTSYTYFDFLSPTTYLVAQPNGELVLIDVRTEGYKCEKRHSYHKLLRCVNVHPVNKDLFLTGGCVGSIRLWDLRNLKRQPVVEVFNHKKCVLAAYFSPVTGNSILSSSCNSISIYDCSNFTNGQLKKSMDIYDCPNFPDGQLKKSMPYIGESSFQTAFKATWLPSSEEIFHIGSKEMPRRIQIYDKNFNLFHSVMHENLISLAHINAFHPFKPFFVACNANGKIFLFTHNLV